SSGAASDATRPEPTRTCVCAVRATTSDSRASPATRPTSTPPPAGPCPARRPASDLLRKAPHPRGQPARLPHLRRLARHRPPLTTPTPRRAPARPGPGARPPLPENPAMPTWLRLILAALTIALISASTAAGVAYLMLDDTTWTDARPARPPATATAVPAPAAPTAPADPTARWRLGSCLTENLQATTCEPGTWHIVGVVQDPGPDPCTGIPGQP